MNRLLLLGIILLAVMVLGACGRAGPGPAAGQEIQVEGGSYRDITPAQLKALLPKNDFLLVNVHIPYEGEIPGTDLFVPYNQIEQNLSQFPQNKEAKIVLYCRSGPMSDMAARTLVRLGFTQVWNLEGGMVEWKRQGYELLSKPK